MAVIKKIMCNELGNNIIQLGKSVLLIIFMVLRWPTVLPNKGFHWWLSGKESACQNRRHGFDPWVGKIPWRKKWQPTPVFLPAKSHGQKSLAGINHGVRKSQTWLSNWALRWLGNFYHKHHCLMTQLITFTLSGFQDNRTRNLIQGHTCL